MVAQPQQANQGYPIPGTPVVMPDTGLATQVWARFFLTLWSALFGTNRIGQLFTFASASPTALTSGVSAIVGSIDLPPGNWEVTGAVQFSGSALNIAVATSSIGTAPLGIYQGPAVQTISIIPFPYSVSLAVTTTVNMTAMADFASGTVNAVANLVARRVSMVNN